MGQKIRYSAEKMLSEELRNKKGAGRIAIRPAWTPVFAMSDYSVFHGWVRSDLGRQDCTTLCTTAGQNLTAVSSSHSLTETVDLGSVTAAGLVGTLHGIHLLIKVTYAQQSF